MKCRRLTTSPGRLFRSLKGVSRVFVSTFSKTTSSSDLFFTLCKEEKKKYWKNNLLWCAPEVHFYNNVLNYK